MRSLAVKLTLAFVFVGLIGAVLVALIVRQRTQAAFDRFVVDRTELSFAEALAQYYRLNGSWDGVESLYWLSGENSPQPPNYGLRRDIDLSLMTTILVGADRRVAYSRRVENIGRLVPERELRNATPIELENQVVGWIQLVPLDERWERSAAENIFLSNLNRAVFLSAVVAVGIALLLGSLLAYSLMRRLRELTAATQKVAGGDLGYQVTVPSEDELGELARSFNRMSTDLARANQARRQMTADIAHDLRSPLSVILGYTEALSDGKIEGSPEIYTVMHKEAGQLNHLIEDLRTLSLVDAGELPLNLQSISAKELLEDVSRAYQHQADVKGINLKLDVPVDMPKITVDPNRMVQVLGNLVSNALRYTPESGEIVLGMTSSAGKASLYVRDNGIGIAEADLPYIFNRFYRSDKARQQNGETGLGLSIARSLIEAQGGTIAVESSPGRGTSFIIEFPQSKPGDAPAKA